MHDEHIPRFAIGDLLPDAKTVPGWEAAGRAVVGPRKIVGYLVTDGVERALFDHSTTVPLISDIRNAPSDMKTAAQWARDSVSPRNIGNHERPDAIAFTWRVVDSQRRYRSRAIPIKLYGPQQD